MFYEPLHIENMLTKEELNQAFPNLFEILKLHRELNKDLQEAKERDGHVVKHIGDILLDRVKHNFILLIIAFWYCTWWCNSVSFTSTCAVISL